MVIVAVCALLIANEAKSAEYDLTIDREAANIGTVRLSFDNPLNSATHAFTRHQTAIDLHRPFCENLAQNLNPSGSGWIVPEGCSVIVWETSFNSVKELDHNLSDQINIYHRNGWWLYSEWGSLLRLDGQDGPSRMCATAGAEKVCRNIPKTSEPPLLLPIGKPTLTSKVAGVTIRLFAGDLPSNFKIESLLHNYEEQLQYLRSVLGQRVDAQLPGALDIVVLGIDGAHGSSGGAAGKSSILTNVVVEDAQISESEAARLLWITGHELAHMLGLGTQALWASESLAHYYGYRSVEHLHASPGLFRKMSDDLSEIGLVEANRRVENGQRQYYGIFYSKGARFWRELDELIAAETNGHARLDDYLPLLVEGDFGLDGELPRNFVDELRSVIASARLSQILQDYL